MTHRTSLVIPHLATSSSFEFMKRLRESDGARTPLGRGSTEAAEVRHAQTSSKPVSYTQAAEATTNNENDNNEPRARRTAFAFALLLLIMKPARESDSAPTPRKQLDGCSRGAIYATEAACPFRTYTHRSRASSKSTADGAKHSTQELSTLSARDTPRGRRVRVIKV